MFRIVINSLMSDHRLNGIEDRLAGVEVPVEAREIRRADLHPDAVSFFEQIGSSP